MDLELVFSFAENIRVLTSVTKLEYGYDAEEMYFIGIQSYIP